MTRSVPITVYDTATGAIRYSCDIAEAKEPSLLPGESWSRGKHSGASHWINPETGKPNKRRAMPAKIAAGVVSGVPAGAEAIEGGEAFAVDGGAVAFEADQGLEQDVEIELRHPRFLPAVVMVPCGALVDAPEGAMRREIKQDAAALRRAEYDRQGLTMEALTVALIEGDEAEIARIRSARGDVKARLPKK